MNHHFLDELNSMKPLDLKLWTNVPVDFGGDQYKQYPYRPGGEGGEPELPEDYKF